MKNKRSLGVILMAISLLAGCNEQTSGFEDISYPEFHENVTGVKDEVPGVKFLYGYTDASQQFDWEEYAYDASLTNYYYYDLGTSQENNIKLENPEEYALYQATQPRAAIKHKSQPRSKMRGFEEVLDEEGNHVQFQGPLSEDEFFSYAETLSKSNATAGTKTLSANLKENLNYIYWEMEEGYKSLEQEVAYNIYENNIIVQNVVENKSVAIDDEYLEHKDIIEESKGRILVDTINGEEYIVEVHHKFPKEGEEEVVLGEDEKYPIPDNYRVLSKVYGGKNQLSQLYTFSMQSSLVEPLTRANFYKKDRDGNLIFNKKYEWLSSEIEENGNTKLVYSRNQEFTGIYAGQKVVDSIYVSIMPNGKIDNYGYMYTFYYFGEPLQEYDLKYTYSYETIGNYTITAEENELFDHNKYYDMGTLLPTIESQELDDNAEAMYNQILDYQLEGKVNEPTGAVYETYARMDKDFYFGNYYNELYAEYVAQCNANGETPMSLEQFYNSANYDYDYEVQTKLDSSLYNDNVVVSYYSENGAGLDEFFYAESAVIQRFNQDGNSYEVRNFHGNSRRYEDGKIVKEGQTETFSLLNDSGSVYTVLQEIGKLFKEAKKASSNLTIKITAEKIEAGVDKDTNEYVEEHYVITAQAATQQETTYNNMGEVESNKVGVLFTYEIGFKFID